MLRLKIAVTSRRRAAYLLPILVLGGVSCEVATMPAGDAWYGRHYAIMQDFERNAYRALSDDGKKAFQDLFWTARDPGTHQIFLERLEFIKNAFKRENARQPWNTDRARIYILNGPPAAVDIDQNTDWGTVVTQEGNLSVSAVDRSNEDVQAYRAEVWTYVVRKQYVKYVFRFVQPNEWKMSPASVAGNQYVGALENDNKTVTFGPRDADEYRRAVEALEKKK